MLNTGERTSEGQKKILMIFINDWLRNNSSSKLVILKKKMKSKSHSRTHPLLEEKRWMLNGILGGAALFG